MCAAKSSPFPNTVYTVGWISALPVEMAAAKGMMDEEHGDLQTAPQPADKNTYLLGRMGKFNIVVACLPKHEFGSSSAAVVAKDMLFTFPNIRIGLLVGIGAGIPDYESDDIQDIRLGDVVISSDKENGGVVAYDFGKRLADGSLKSMYALDRPPRALRTAIATLEADHLMRENRIPQYISEMLAKYPLMKKKGYVYPGQAADKLFRPDYPHVSGRTCKKCDSDEQIEREPEERLDTDPVIHYGVIATGSTVVKHAPTRAEIGRDHRAICLEMEAAGLMNNFPCVVIRGISDFADSHKNDQWQPYAAATAAACAKELLDYVQQTSVEQERPAKDVLGQIATSVSIIETGVSNIESGVSKIAAAVDSEQKATILSWLTLTDYGSQQSDLIRKRQRGTGEWLLNSSEFQAWRGESNQVLFCPGIPGAGKTVITSIVVEHLQQEFRAATDVGIAYVYCDFRRQQEQEPENLLASLLKQLIQGHASPHECVAKLYQECEKTKLRPAMHEILEALRQVVAAYSRVFILIDAVDECQVANMNRATFLSEIFQLRVQTGANILATSRPIPDIMGVFEGNPTLEIRAQDEDVLKYLDGQMSGLPSFVTQSIELQKEIKAAVIKAVDGMFLLARLHMDSLSTQPTRGHIKQALKRLPRGIDETYQQAVKRIQSQGDGFRNLAEKILAWITNAKRLLYTFELREALAVEFGTTKLNEDYLPDVEIFGSICAGLVVVDEKSDIVRLVHYTTQEFFERELLFPEAEADIATVCVTYLSFSEFSSGLCLTDSDLAMRISQNPLYEYAARNWGHHARAASSVQVHNLVSAFLENEAKLSASNQVMSSRSRGNARPYKYYKNFSQEGPKGVTSLHIAAHYGLSKHVKALLASGHDPDCRDSYKQTPLWLAARNGHDKVVELLLASGQVNPDAIDSQQRLTPLMFAAENGYTTVARLLLETGRVDADYWSKKHYSYTKRTPLSRAAENGHEAVVELLLKTTTVDPDSKGGSDSRTPLSYAAGRGHESIVKLLLATGRVNPDSWFTTYRSISSESDAAKLRTPLSYAAERGHDAVVKLLLATGEVDVDPKTSRFRDRVRAPLSYAAERGHREVVKLLLATDGIDPNSCPRFGNMHTPLAYAAEGGHLGVVELLLCDTKVDPDAEGESGRTPLSLASENGYEKVVELLLSTNRVNLDSSSYKGQTPLSFAAMNGHAEVVKLLLGRNQVDRELKVGEDSRTALASALESRHKMAAELLSFTNRANPDFSSHGGQTPLSFAAMNGHEEVVRLLLGTNQVNQESKASEGGRSPLSYAAGYGHEGVCKLLLTGGGVNPDSGDSSGQTPLSFAVEAEHEAVAKLLLSIGGVNPNSKSSSGMTPLLHAVKNGHAALVKLLLGTVSVEPGPEQKEEAQMALFLAMENRNEAVVEILLQSDWMNADLGAAPLAQAAREGYLAIVKLLLARDGVDPDGRVATTNMDRSWKPLALILLFSTRVDGERTPLSFAAEAGHEEVVRVLLANDRVDPDSRETQSSPTTGRTPLSYAAENGHEGIVKLLLATDRVDPDSRDDGSSDGPGETPLSYAASGGYTAIVKLLLDTQRVDAFPDDSESRDTPLMKAAWSGHVEVIKMLLDKGVAEARPVTSDWNRLLTWAVSGRSDKSVKLLLAAARAETGSRGLERSLLPCAAERKAEATVRLLLETARYDSDSQYAEEQTALSHAAENGHAGIVQMLLATGRTDLDVKCREKTPLCLAAKKGHDKIVKLILAHDRVDPESFAEDWANALWLAIAGSYKAVVQELISKEGVDIDSQSPKEGRTPLLWAVSSGHTELVELLLQRGANPNLKQNDGMTPIWLAMESRRELIVELLLESDAVDINAENPKIGQVNKTGKINTPLSWAAIEGAPAVVEALLQKGANPDARGPKDERTPLSLAAENGHASVVKLLLAQPKVNPNSQNSISGSTPLLYAVEKGHTGVVKLLLDADQINPDARDKRGRTPLSYAAAHGHASLVKLLLATGKVDVDSRADSGRNPLSFAAEEGNTAVVKLLLATGQVDPDSKSSTSKRTALSYAAEKGRLDVVELLLTSGRVNPDSKDARYERTPLSYAAGKGYAEVVKLLLANDRVDPDSKSVISSEYNDSPRCGLRTPLSFAAESGETEVVALLLANNAVDPNFQPTGDFAYGKTALSFAAEKGHDEVVKLLLADDRVDPDSKSTELLTTGQTPLWQAAVNGHKEVAKMLLATGRVDPQSEDFEQPLLIHLMEEEKDGEEGKGEIIKLLVEADQVDPNVKDSSQGRTLLSHAAEAGRDTIVKILLAVKRVDPNDKDPEFGQTPLWYAVVNGHEGVVKLLLKRRDIDANCQPTGDSIYSGWTPLAMAVDSGYEEIVKLLLAADQVSPNCRDPEYGRTPLSHAAESGQEGIVKIMLAVERVDPDSQDATDSRTPLSYAAERGHEGVVKMFLRRKGVNLNAPSTCESKKGWTPLSWAVESGDEAVVKRLLEREGVDTNPTYEDGQTLLMHVRENGTWALEDLLMGMRLLSAAAIGDEQEVSLLLEDDARVDFQNDAGRTALSLAAGNGHKGVVHLLLSSYDADVNLADMHNRTPLSWAAENGHVSTAKLLLDVDGAYPDIQDANGWTPLLWVARFNHQGLEWLYEDPEARDSEDESSSEFGDSENGDLWTVDSGAVDAEVSEDDNERADQSALELMEILLARDDIDPEVTDVEDRTPLSWAAHMGSEASVRLLLAHERVEPDSKDSQKRTPLSWAAAFGRDAIVGLLLETQRVNPDSKDKNGWTPLSWAVRFDGDDGDDDDNNKEDWETDDGEEEEGAGEGLGNENSEGDENGGDSYDGDTHNADGHGEDNGYGNGDGDEAASNALHVIQILLARDDVNADAADKRGRTPISWAAEWGHVTIVKLLLGQNGVKPDSRDKSGRSPLSWAAMNGHVLIMEQLLAVGADPDSKDKFGRTPLFWAAREPDTVFSLDHNEPVELESQHLHAVEMLLKREDVDPDSVDVGGRTPLSWASQSGNLNVAMLLATRGVNPDPRDATGRSPLFWAVWSGNIDLVALLLGSGRVDSDARDTYGQSPLSIAARKGYKDIVEYLLAAGAVGVGLGSTDDRARAPITWAATNGKEEVVKLLRDEYDRKDMFFAEDWEELGTPRDDNSDAGFCDVCLLGIAEDSTFSECSVCNGGDFVICAECSSLILLCLDPSHTLIETSAREKSQEEEDSDGMSEASDSGD